MKLWLISQTDASGYDTYDSAVVAAETEADAKAIYPSEGLEWSDSLYRVWAASPDLVTATLIGEAVPEIIAGEIICASYNAG
jgi:hypothetical protein